MVFKSNIAGEVKLDWAEVKELRSTDQFAVIEKGKHITQKTPNSEVPQGSITATGTEINVKGTSAAVAVHPYQER